MAGPACAVYCRCEQIQDVRKTVLAHIKRVVSKIDDKSNIWIKDRPISVAIRAVDYDSGHDDDLLDLNLLPEDVPVLIELGAGCKSEIDYQIFRDVSKQFAEMFNAIATEPIK